MNQLNLELLNRSGASWRGQVERFERSAAIERLERFEQHPMLEGLKRQESLTSIELLSVTLKGLSRNPYGLVVSSVEQSEPFVEGSGKGSDPGNR